MVNCRIHVMHVILHSELASGYSTSVSLVSFGVLLNKSKFVKLIKCKSKELTSVMRGAYCCAWYVILTTIWCPIAYTSLNLGIIINRNSWDLVLEGKGLFAQAHRGTLTLSGFLIVNIGFESSRYQYNIFSWLPGNLKLFKTRFSSSS